MTSEQPRPEAHTEQTPPPRARLKQLALSWIWAVPVGALLLSGYLIYDLISERGPTVTIDFDSAAGLVAHSTPVTYRAVTLGMVDAIDLSNNLGRVQVRVRMTAQAEPLLKRGARFWVVRPRLAGGLRALTSGLETLVSGAYIAMDPGQKNAEPERHFRGLEQPPSVRSDEPGTVLLLESDALRGLSAGAPVYHREVRVGEVLGYSVEPSAVRVRVFVAAPFDAQVKPQTRFWNASGLRVSSGAGGLDL